jgi:PQQ-dependent catabolism-associated CXXCW motif protein
MQAVVRSAFAMFLITSTAAAYANDAVLPEVKAPATAPSHDVEIAEPDDYRTDKYREPVPKTLKGAKVVTTVDAEALHKDGMAVFIDVYPQAPKPPNLPAGTFWRDPQHLTVPGASWLPNVGYGKISPETEAGFKAHLKQLSGGDANKALVFYCLRNCWMSWNAAKRAMVLGYTNVVWFPDGNDGWQEAGNELAEVKPLPPAAPTH